MRYVTDTPKRRGGRRYRKTRRSGGGSFARGVPGSTTETASRRVLAFARIPRAVWRSPTRVWRRASRARRARAAFNTREIASWPLDRPSRTARWNSLARVCREWGSRKGAGEGARARCTKRRVPWDTDGPRRGTPPAPGGGRSPRREIGSRTSRKASRARGCPVTDFPRTCGTSPSRPPSPRRPLTSTRRSRTPRPRSVSSCRACNTCESVPID